MEDHDLLQRIDERVAILPELKEHLATIDKRLDRHNSRLSSIEMWAKIVGGVLIAAWAAIVKFLVAH